MNKSSIIVAFEGIDGSGKTTQALRLYQMLQESGVQSQYYHTPKSADLRKIIISKLQERNPNPKEIIDLFNQDIKICLKTNQDQVLIADRWTYSSYANWIGQGITHLQVREMTQNIPMAEICFFMDVRPEEIQNRRIDPEDMQHHIDVQKIKYANYLEYIVNLPEVVIINGTMLPSMISDIIYTTLIEINLISGERK